MWDDTRMSRLRMRRGERLLRGPRTAFVSDAAFPPTSTVTGRPAREFARHAARSWIFRVSRHADDRDRLSPAPPHRRSRHPPDAGYQCYTLTAVCSDCQRYTPLDHATLAERFGWDMLIPEIKRRVRCAQCGRRTGGLIVGTKPR